MDAVTWGTGFCRASRALAHDCRLGLLRLNALFNEHSCGTNIRTNSFGAIRKLIGGLGMHRKGVWFAAAAVLVSLVSMHGASC
jgi:hypothetical protein